MVISLSLCIALGNMAVLTNIHCFEKEKTIDSWLLSRRCWSCQKLVWHSQWAQGCLADHNLAEQHQTRPLCDWDGLRYETTP